MALFSIKSIAIAAAVAFVSAITVTSASVTASAASTALVEWDGTAADGFAGGTGTEDDPYLISNAQELAYFVSVTGYRANNEGDYFKLTSDILLNDSFDDSPNVWKNQDMFEGVFDGDGHTIYGLYQISANEAGVIGSLTETGVIKNLNVADAYITKAIGSAGIICGPNQGTISNCTASGYIHSYVSYVGGICSAASLTGVVENCVNYATVECNDVKAGGIAGAAQLGGAIRNCYNAGNVSGTHSNSYQIGGICGYLEGGSVTGCGNIGNVTNAGRGSGGVVGMMYDTCTVTNCYNTGNISATDDVGGVWGYMNNTQHSVSYCYNAGDVVATESTASREYQIGDFVDGCVSNVYYDSNVCTAAYSTNTPYAKTTSQLTTSAVITNLGFDAKIWSKSTNTSTFLRYPNLTAISVDDPKFRQGTAVDISTATISAIHDQGYAAVALTPEVIVTRGVERLVEGRDYTVAYSNNTNIGTATVKITGKGNYSGTKSATFKIVAKPAGGLLVPEITGQVFTGSALKPSFKVYNGTKLLTSGTDYTYTYSNNINAGNGIITITGKGSYTGTKTVKFEIGKKDISLLTFPAIPDQYYDFGNTIWPKLNITDGSYVLEYYTDYTTQGIAGMNNSKIGEAGFKVCGKGNYKSYVELSFNIVPIPAEQFVVSDIPDQTYTGSAITPKFTVKAGGRTLTAGTNYSVAYSNNINPGTATITITGLDYCTGTKTVNFSINKSISGASVSAISDQTYTGSAIKPAVTVKDGSTTLKSGTHYTVSYSNNTNVGTATVTITGKGNYTGTKTATFKITAKSISGATVSAIADQTYTGSEIKPAVTVKNGSATLVNGTDYTVSYSNNINAGTATVTITGKGNYTGTKTATFKITAISISGATVSAIADQTYTGSAIKPAVTVKVGSTTLVNGTDYTVSYSDNINAGTATVTITGKGNYTGTKTITFVIVKPVHVDNVKAVAGDGQVTITWDAVSGASKYALYSYLDGKYTLVGATSRTAYIVSDLTNGTTYGFLVRAYVNGAWSAYTKADIVYATPVSAAVVELPEITTITPGDGQVTLIWSKPEGAIKYAIYSYTKADGYKLIGTTSKNAYIVSGLTNGTAYGFLVRACGSNGQWSAYTKADNVYATPVSSEIVGKPEITTITPGDGKMTLIWSKPDGAIKYAVYSYTRAEGYKLIGTTSKNAYIVSGLTNGTAYGFLVRACGSNGQWSEYTKADNVYATPTA